MSARQWLTAALWLGVLIVLFFLGTRVWPEYFRYFGGAAWVILFYYCFGMMCGFSQGSFDDWGGQSRNQTAALWALGVAVFAVCYWGRLISAPEAITTSAIITAFAFLGLFLR